MRSYVVGVVSLTASILSGCGSTLSSAGSLDTTSPTTAGAVPVITAVGAASTTSPWSTDVAANFTGRVVEVVPIVTSIWKQGDPPLDSARALPVTALVRNGSDVEGIVWLGDPNCSTIYAPIITRDGSVVTVSVVGSEADASLPGGYCHEILQAYRVALPGVTASDTVSDQIVGKPLDYVETVGDVFRESGYFPPAP